MYFPEFYDFNEFSYCLKEEILLQIYQNDLKKVPFFNDLTT